MAMGKNPVGSVSANEASLKNDSAESGVGGIEAWRSAREAVMNVGMWMPIGSRNVGSGLHRYLRMSCFRSLTN